MLNSLREVGRYHQKTLFLSKVLIFFQPVQGDDKVESELLIADMQKVKTKRGEESIWPFFA